ncbi:hypothetical protein GOV10_00580 [Candidatus Woesearchaeota archaeon]|nr:hypothetical protein [Candidatus Woesearchaeota archaeon]
MKTLLALLFCSFLLVSCTGVTVCNDVTLDCTGVSEFYQCGKFIKEIPATLGDDLQFYTAGCLPDDEHISFSCPVGNEEGNSPECDEAIHYTCELIKECP